MAKQKRRRGRLLYGLALYIWGLLLIAGAVFGLMKVWEYAEEFERSRPAALSAYAHPQNLRDQLLRAERKA